MPKADNLPQRPGRHETQIVVLSPVLTESSYFSQCGGTELYPTGNGLRNNGASIDENPSAAFSWI